VKRPGPPFPPPPPSPRATSRIPAPRTDMLPFPCVAPRSPFSSFCRSCLPFGRRADLAGGFGASAGATSTCFASPSCLGHLRSRGRRRFNVPLRRMMIDIIDVPGLSSPCICFFSSISLVGDLFLFEKKMLGRCSFLLIRRPLSTWVSVFSFSFIAPASIPSQFRGVAGAEAPAWDRKRLVPQKSPAFDASFEIVLVVFFSPSFLLSSPPCLVTNALFFLCSESSPISIVWRRPLLFAPLSFSSRLTPRPLESSLFLSA